MKVGKLRAERPASLVKKCHQQGCEEMCTRLGGAESVERMGG